MSQPSVGDISASTEQLDIIINTTQPGMSLSTKISSKDVRSGIPVRLLTHNIRYATSNPFPGEELWSVRRGRLCSELVFHSASVPATFVCLQEVLHGQIVDISESLNDGDEWAYIGVGRDDGKKAGEYSPIFYRPSVWKLEKWRTVWLSETPDKAGSKGWDASSIRIVTIGRFRHASNNQPVIIFSTHFDDAGVVSRKKSAELVLKLVTEYQASTEWKEPVPVLLAGDFNSTPDGEAYQIVTSSSSPMVDIRGLVPVEKRHGNEMTFTSFGTIDDTPSRIDFLFVNRHRLCLFKTYAVLPNWFDDGVYLSDHRAVVADLMLLPLKSVGTAGFD